MSSSPYQTNYRNLINNTGNGKSDVGYGYIDELL